MASTSRTSLAALAAALALAGCSDDEKKPYDELLFFNDGYALKAADASGGAVKLVGGAEIPGYPGTYVRDGNTVTVTMPFHSLWTGFPAELVFSAGTGGTATSGVYLITVVDDDTFTVEDPASGTITGGKVLRRFVTTRAATYEQAGTTLTVTLPDHDLSARDAVDLDFTSGTAADGLREVVTVVDDDTFTVTMETDATTAGNVTVQVGGNYGIFGVTVHPSGRWVYTTSTYECWNGDPLCWGSGLISRFAIDWKKGKLTFEESVIAPRESAAPVSIVFDAAGTVMYNQDDDLDGVDMWTVDAGGHLTHVAESESNDAYLHGLALSADGALLYNGLRVFSTDTTPGEEGLTRLDTQDFGANSCVLRGATLFAASYWPWALTAYSLEDPAAPAVIDSVTTDNINQTREIVVTQAGDVAVTAGFSGLKSYTFDGATFSEVEGGEYIDLYEAWDHGEDVETVFRSLAMDASETLLAGAYFTHDDNSNLVGGVPPSGVMLFRLAADGTITRIANYDQAGYTRAARFFKKP